MTEYVWATVNLGVKRRMLRSKAIKGGYDFESVGGLHSTVEGSPSLCLNEKVLSTETARSVFLQTGKHCDTWGDVKKALRSVGSRVVEPGDKIHKELEQIRGDREPCKPVPGDAEKAEKLLTDLGRIG